jgi:hypothetical protein
LLFSRQRYSSCSQRRAEDSQRKRFVSDSLAFSLRKRTRPHLTIEKAESYTAEMKAMDNKLRALYLERTTADEVTIKQPDESGNDF